MFVFAKDSALRFTFANQALTVALGTDPIGHTDQELFTDARAVQFFNETDRALLARTAGRIIGGPMRVHSRLCIAEEYFDDVMGRRRWLATVKQPIFMPDGTVELLGVSMDITELRELKMHLAAVGSSATQCIYVKSPFGRFTYANEAFSSAIGVPLTQIIGKTDFDLFPAEYAEEWKLEEQEIMRSRIPLLNHPRMVFAKGDKPRIRLVTKVPLRDSSGQIEGIVGMATDITSLVTDSDELWTRIGNIRRIVADAPDCVFIKDRFGRFVAVNEAFVVRRNAQGHGAVIGTTDYDWSTRKQADKYRADDKRVFRNSERLGPYIEEQLLADGKVAVLLTIKAPLVGPRSSVLGLAGAYVDITAQMDLPVEEWKDHCADRLNATISKIQGAWRAAR